jgi:autotransporter-associated beta strand protein
LGGGAYAQPITDNGALNYNSAAAQTLSGVLSGSGPLEVGAGTLVLGAANTYTNNTTINNGVAVVQNSAAFGTGNVLINGGGIMFSTNPLVGYSLANAFFFTNTSIIDMNHSTNSESMYGAWSGTGTVIISNLDWVVPGENLQTLTIGGNTATATMNAFTGKLVVAPMNSDGLVSQGSLRFNSGGTSYNTGNTNASFNLGTNVNNAVSLTSRDAGVINLGELIGGPSDRSAGFAIHRHPDLLERGRPEHVHHLCRVGFKFLNDQHFGVDQGGHRHADVDRHEHRRRQCLDGSDRPDFDQRGDIADWGRRRGRNFDIGQCDQQRGAGL